jgi:hypothetical protein
VVVSLPQNFYNHRVFEEDLCFLIDKKADLTNYISPPFSFLALWNFYQPEGREVEFYQRLAIPANTIHSMPAYASQMVLGELFRG